jgi:gliding motility-associated-like protein
MGEGNYNIEVVHPESFCRNFTSVNVSASGDLSLGNILVDSINCFGDEGRIQVENLEGTPPIELRLNDELIEIGEWISNLPAGEYVIEAEDVNGCRAGTRVTLVEGVPIEINLEPLSANVDEGETVRVEVQTNIEEDEIASVLWSPPTNLSCTDCLSTTVTAISDEEYEVTITDDRGCFATTIFRLLVRSPQMNIFIPNIFTPNGDGVNDGFTLFTDPQVSIDQFLIFDRWGNMIFETRNISPNDTQMGWDGRSKGQLVNEGVYVYSIHITLPNGIEEVIQGDLPVIR